MKYIVSKPSAIHAGSCILGSGDSKPAALVDAFGPKPWSPYTKRSAADCCVREVSDEEWEKLCWG